MEKMKCLQNPSMALSYSSFTSNSFTKKVAIKKAFSTIATLIMTHFASLLDVIELMSIFIFKYLKKTYSLSSLLLPKTVHCQGYSICMSQHKGGGDAMNFTIVFLKNNFLFIV